MEFERLLVRATNWVGDAVMCIPALQALRERFPSAYIAILARPWVAGLYGREPFCDELISYDSPRGWVGLRGKWRLAHELSLLHFDCAVLFQNAFEAAALVAAADIPVRIGYDRDARGWLLTDAVKPPMTGEVPTHERFYYLELLKRAGLLRSYSLQSAIRLTGASEAARAGRARFAAHGVHGSVIGVSPGAAYGGAKRWLPDRFGQAAVEIAEKTGFTIALFGSPAEQEVCARVSECVLAAGFPCLNFSGSTSLDEFIELAAACSVYITNDSGPMHIASALGVPTVAVFGPTDEYATGPTGDRSQVIREPVECSPCLLRECPIDHRCMTRVDARRVSTAALTLLS